MAKQEICRMKFFKTTVAGIALFACASSVNAAGEDLLKKFAEDTAELRKTYDLLTEDLGAAFSYKAITPAEPLSGGILPIGLDFGFELSAVKASNIDEWRDAFGLSSSMEYLPVPKIHAHLGIPFGIDFGAVYAPIPGTDINYIGGEVRYSFVSGNVALPAIALRGAYTTVQGIDEWEFNNTSVELTISKGVLMFTPYAGIGNVWTTSNLSHTIVESGVSTDIKFESDASLVKWFVGVNLNLGLMNIVAEVDQTGESMTYSGKLGFRF